MPDLKRYELFGWDYERLNPLGPKEVAWYLGHAKETGGPILELACGSGRLLCWLAEAGYAITGMDLCDAMLAIARERIAGLSDLRKGNAALLKAEMSDFALGRAFPLIILADNSFRHLAQREEQLACLRCVRNHLADGGRFLLTERRLNASHFHEGRRRFGWSEPTTAPDGSRVRRRGEMRLADGGRWMSGEFLYEITSPNGTVRNEQCAVEAPIMTPDDYRTLLRDAGLTAEIFADYTNDPADDDTHTLCFVCEATKNRVP